MFVVCGIWCLADVSSVSPSSGQPKLRVCILGLHPGSRDLQDFVWEFTRFLKIVDN